ncbi:hypothetical protein ACROYT_G025225 [Oculina patagonica]
MSMIVTAVFKATIGLLVNKGRDKAADSLKDGDVTDQKFRGLIVREIDDVKSKLDGLSRKDLLSSISFFEEGIELLYEVFDKARSKGERGAETTQAACAEAFAIAEGVNKLELTGLDESAARALSNAKKRFEDSRRKATEAFNNEALETYDRIQAMEYRVMATILETVDNPTDAVAPCRVCIEELNSLSAVQNSFGVHLEKSKAFKRWFGKAERRQIIASVCHVNRVIFDVTQTACKDMDPWIWPAVDTGKDKVDPLRDQRLARVLHKRGMEHCCVTWSFGQEGTVEHKLKEPVGIATNSSGQFIVADRQDRNVKMFDSSGKFIKHFSFPKDDVDTKLYIHGVATDMNDDIYVLVEFKKRGAVLPEPAAVYKFSNTGDLHHKFPVKGGEWKWYRVIVTDSGKVLVLRGANVVDVYETDGQFVRTFGEETFKFAFNMTAANDGRVMVVDKDDSFVHIFNEDGDHLNKFKRHGSYRFPEIAFHRASEHVVIAYADPGKQCLHLELYTKDGEFVRSTQIHEDGIEYLRGITMTMEGGIAIVLRDSHSYKILVL